MCFSICMPRQKGEWSQSLESCALTSQGCLGGPEKEKMKQFMHTGSKEMAQGVSMRIVLCALSKVMGLWDTVFITALLMGSGATSCIERC